MHNHVESTPFDYEKGVDGATARAAYAALLDVLHYDIGSDRVLTQIESAAETVMSRFVENNESKIINAIARAAAANSSKEQ